MHLFKIEEELKIKFVMFRENNKLSCSTKFNYGKSIVIIINISGRFSSGIIFYQKITSIQNF